MLSLRDISVGDRFIVVNDGKTKRSPAFLINVQLARPEKIRALKKGVEFEIIRAKSKFDKKFSYGIKLAGTEETAEVYCDDVRERCEKIGSIIKVPALEYNLSEIAPRVYCVQFKDSYDLAMTFLRYQECYESNSPQFKNRSFAIVDYMRWYAKNLGNGEFTYVKDWGGFNIPSKIIEMNMAPGFIKDWNMYDSEMRLIDKTIKSAQKNDGYGYYLIGTCASDITTLRHEVAHGLYATNNDYKHNMNDLVESYTPAEVKTAMFEILKNMGYDESVFKDELQAYFATGLTSTMQAVEVIANYDRKYFLQRFDDFTKEVLFGE